jgi:BirA family biotin operon repressor/biotin-[acetyl-CoA-carboxylase] ligase
MSGGGHSFSERSADADSVYIVRALMEAGEGFVSGTELAAALGVSRPAVHGKLEKLREAGFVVEAIRNRGYRMAELPEIVHPALLRYELDRMGSAMEVAYHPVIDSTNNEAERRAASGQRGPFAVVASCQTTGRGRLGRDWHSASAENLYLSVLFEPNIPPQQLQHFTLWAGIHICRALQAFVPAAPLQIKWPNDLQCKGRKFAGMLTEAKIDADAIRSIVFGIGLNVNSNPNAYPPDLRQRATSLYAVHGESLPLNCLAAAVVRAVEAAYGQSLDPEAPAGLPAAWAPLDALRDQPVTALLNGAEISGAARGIDASGALLIELADGSQRAVRAGDVTLKK